MLPRCFALLLALGWASLLSTAGAQATNRALYEQLAATCLAAPVDTVQAFQLGLQSEPRFLQSALLQTWIGQGKTVYEAPDTLVAASLPALSYTAERAIVDYARAGRKRLNRAVTLALTYRLTAPDGRVLASDRCDLVHRDTIARRDLEAVEDPSLPLTQGTVPPPGWIRRYLEPTVLVAATGIVTYLFFSLRSNRDDEG